MLLLCLFTFLKFYLNNFCSYSISPNSLEILKTKGGWKTSTEKAEAAYSHPALIPRGCKKTLRECSPGLREKLIRSSRKAYKKRVTVIRGKHRNPALVSFPGLLINAGEGGKSRRNVKPAWKTPEQKNYRLQEMGPLARAHPGRHSLQGKACSQRRYWLEKHSSPLLLPYLSSCLLLSYW